MDTTSPSPSPSETTRMTRPKDGRMLAGVAAALAERTEIDVNVIRIAFVLTSFFGGFGLLAYVAGWALLPEEGETHSPAQRWFGTC
ncbi:MAG TPA: PspC domain-containing protein [Acidimicrobiia bacterium]|nr:PspC domain-containing protein [Acidimicrobiia bacterium]